MNRRAEFGERRGDAQSRGVTDIATSKSILEGDVGPGLSGDMMVFSLAESTGNVWMAAEK